MNDNLPELRDIHLPDGVSLWPPAYGWFIIVAAVIGGYVLYRLFRLWRIKSRKLYALRMLNNLDKENITTSAVAVSEILRRICVYMYPDAVSLDGDEWVKFLKRTGRTELTERGAGLLKNAPYMNPQKQSYNTIDLQDLIEFSRKWIGENL